MPVGPADGQGDAVEQQVELITFDSYPANISGSGAAEPITDEFASQGLIFPNGATALVFDETSFPPRPDLPRSGDTVITSCYSQEFCSSTISMAFDPPLAELTMYAGYYSGLAEPAELILDGLDGNGEVVSSQTVVIGASDEAIPASTPITVADADGRIEGALIRWADTNRFLSLLIVDDVTVVPFVATPALTIEPEAVEVTVEEETVREVVRFSNTGNVALPLGSLTLERFDPPLEETGLSVSLDYDPQCLQRIEPGQSCDAVLVMTPDPDNEVASNVQGFLILRAQELLSTNVQASQSALATPVSIAVVPTVAEQPVDDTTTTLTTTDNTDNTGSETSTGSEQEEEQTATTTGGGDGSDPDPNDEWWIPLVVVGAIVLLGIAVRRWLRRRRKAPEPPSAPPPPTPRPPDRQSSNERPDRTSPRPTLTTTPDLGTQSIESADVARPTLVVALNDNPTATILIDHNEGTVQ